MVFVSEGEGMKLEERCYITYPINTSVFIVLY